jgi:hypothetical protein
MINIKTNQKYQQYIDKRIKYIISSPFYEDLDQYSAYYKTYDSLVAMIRDRNLGALISVVYLLRKQLTLEVVQFLNAYKYIAKFKDKPWMTGRAVIRYIKYKNTSTIVNMNMPISQIIFAIHLITTTMTKRPDFTSTLAIAKALNVSSNRIKQLHQMLVRGEK